MVCSTPMNLWEKKIMTLYLLQLPIFKNSKLILGINYFCKTIPDVCTNSNHSLPTILMLQY